MKDTLEKYTQRMDYLPPVFREVMYAATLPKCLSLMADCLEECSYLLKRTTKDLSYINRRTSTFLEQNDEHTTQNQKHITHNI